jgi:hypothetical protein
VTGFGVAPTAYMTAFQPFFASFTLPYSVIRGEIVPVVVTVFNYLSECLVVSCLITIQNTQNFCSPGWALQMSCCSSNIDMLFIKHWHVVHQTFWHVVHQSLTCLFIKHWHVFHQILTCCSSNIWHVVHQILTCSSNIDMLFIKHWHIDMFFIKYWHVVH